MDMVKTAGLSLATAVAFAALLALAGCTTLAMEAMNGPGACDPLLAHQAMYNANVLTNLRDDQTLAELLEIAMPDYVRGQTYYFRTGAPHCSFLATARDFTGVRVTAAGRIVNPGDVFSGPQANAASTSLNPLKSLFR